MSELSVSLASFFELMERRASAEFLVDEQGVMSYASLCENVRRCCSLFDLHQLSEGARVLIVTRDERVAIAVFIAALLDGKVPVMLAPDIPEAHAAAINLSITPSLTVVDGTRREEEWTRGAIITRAKRKAPFISAFSNSSVIRIPMPNESRKPRLPPSVDALAYILFTSGTTQSPNGVMISRRNLFSQLQTLSRLFHFEQKSRIFNSMVLAHADGLVQGPLLAIFAGCTLIRIGAFSISQMEDWLNAVRANRATHFFSVPTVYNLIDRYAGHNDYFDAAEFLCLISVAAKLESALWERLQVRFKRPLYNQYGLTETVVSALYAGPHPEMGPLGTLGKPVDVEARLLGLDGAAVLDGNSGELLLAGKNIFIGYWNNPVRTAEVMTADGWFRTGDLALKRPDGAYEILGRLKTVIMCGGMLIRPDEIDEVLKSHPGVASAVTVGIPNSDFDEVPISAVILDNFVSESDLTNYCRERLEPLKVPKRILAFDAIPRGNSGKPLLANLRTIILSRLEIGPSDPADQNHLDLARDTIRLAATIFRVSPEMLSRHSSPETVPGWDSFSQINLILAAESRFSVLIPAAKIASIRTLHDLIQAIETCQ